MKDFDTMPPLTHRDHRRNETMSNYPEHEKLRAHETTALTLSGFLDFLSERNWLIGEYPENRETLWPIRQRPDEVIGLYLGIDPKKLSKEKDAMVRELQKAANA